ncbi:hypothetical protein AB0758_30895 [Tolypothrix bouteillei VB521301_2]|uniref:hypothetical protein n=1 Tax=Tolypothrix bouteillei TaxID=1246981 RepID=UPI0038B67784
MPYSKFTLSKAVEDFHLTLFEGNRFLPEIPPITPTPLLQDILKETLPWAIAVSSEKARSEGIINPVLLEVKTPATKGTNECFLRLKEIQCKNQAEADRLC